MERPKFTPKHLAADATLDVPPLTERNAQPWIPIITCPANFPIELFEIAISQLIHHPEYNSTLILRSEVIEDVTEDFPSSIPSLEGYIPVRNIHRKLLPRRPTRDAGLEQHCTLYLASDLPSESDGPPSPSLLVLTPIAAPDIPLPYYHPTVSHLAFRYVSSSQSLRIEALPLPGTPLDFSSRLHRTCLALLETLHRYGWGAQTQYKKRVTHDCLVSRETYQDLYLVMRERHKHLVGEWKEVTDPLKHVFEDIGIATFLILLWKQTYEPSSAPNETTIGMKDDYDTEPWKQWPRPPGGFVDLGCGNGLLTHILISEGYSGVGIDLRARLSWSHYPASTQAALHVEALDPTIYATPPSPSGSSIATETLTTDTASRLEKGCFIIGNHADELTPWIPVLSALCDASGYLSIPCCAWVFDAKYERSRDVPYPLPLNSVEIPSTTTNDSTLDSQTEPVTSDLDDPPSQQEILSKFADSLNLGGDATNSKSSSYSMYRIWLASLSIHCGWKIECDTLRIPSTRNWAIVGRTRLEHGEEEMDDYKGRAVSIVDDVRRRGMFKTRRPEGKAGDH